MKARITTVLSLTGVMVAGSAAALVNSQVLRNSNTTASYEVTDQSVPASVVVVSPDDPQVNVGKFDTQMAIAVTSVSIPGSTAKNYYVGSAGYVTLDTAGDVLTMPLAVPTDGWVVQWAGSNDAYSATAVFESATTRLTFKATLIFGVVNESVDVDDLTPETSPPSSPKTTTATTTGTTAVTTTTVKKDDDDHHHHPWWPTTTTSKPTTTTSTTSTSTTTTIRRDD